MALVLMMRVNARKTGNCDRGRGGIAQRRYTGAACCTAGQNIVDEHHVASGQLARLRRSEPDRPAKNPFSSIAAQRAKIGRGAMTHQDIEVRFAFPQSGKFLRQQRSLVEAATPNAPAMQRHRYQNWCRTPRRRLRDLRRYQLC
jgi:hypothetical protein